MGFIRSCFVVLFWDLFKDNVIFIINYKINICKFIIMKIK